MHLPATGYPNKTTESCLKKRLVSWWISKSYGGAPGSASVKTLVLGMPSM